VAEPISPDRPGIADGSGVVEPHTFQIEIGVQQEFRNTGGVGARSTFIPTLLRYGFAPNLEGRFESNTLNSQRTLSPAGDVSNASDLAPLSFGVKYNFSDQTEPLAKPSMGIIARLFLPSGSGDVATRGFTGDLRLAADWMLSDKWSLNPNFGVSVSEDDQKLVYSSGILAMTINSVASDVINPFVDVALQNPDERDGAPALVVDGGFAFNVNDDLAFDISYGRGAQGRKTPQPFWSAGISARF
jgi:hypothetical protein